MKYIFLLLSIVFLSACVSQLNPFSPGFNPIGALQGQQPVRVQEGLGVSLSSSPSEIFAGSKTTLYLDAQNKDVAPIRNIILEIFDTGNLQKSNECKLSIPQLLPDQITALSCTVQATSIIQKTQSETINARAKFQSVLTAVQTLDIMNEEIYTREKFAGNINTRPRAYTYSDRNMQMDIEFSDDMPIVVRKGRQYFVYFTIRNIGNGFVDKITFGENFMPIEQKNLKFGEFKNALQATDLLLTLLQKQSKIFQETGSEETYCSDILCCRDFKTIYPSGKVFPRIACELKLPENAQQLVDYQVLVPLLYNYEVRAQSQLKVVR